MLDSVVLLTVAVEENESDEHQQRMITELLFGCSIPIKSYAVNSHPHSHHDGRCHQQHLWTTHHVPQQVGYEIAYEITNAL